MSSECFDDVIPAVQRVRVNREQGVVEESPKQWEIGWVLHLRDLNGGMGGQRVLARRMDGQSIACIFTFVADHESNSPPVIKWLCSHEACNDKMTAHLYWGSGPPSDAQHARHAFSRNYLDSRRWMQIPNNRNGGTVLSPR